MGCAALGLGTLLLLAYQGHIPTAIIDAGLPARSLHLLNLLSPPRPTTDEHPSACAGAPAAVLLANSHHLQACKREKAQSALEILDCHCFFGSTALGEATGKTTLQVQMSRAVPQGNDGLAVPVSSHQCIRTMLKQRVPLLPAGEILASASCHLSPDVGRYTPALQG